MTFLSREAVAEKPLVALFLATVFALPLLYFPWSTDSFVLPKYVIFSLLVVLLVGFVLGAMVWGRILRVVPAPALAPMLLLPIWAALSGLWAAAPELARARSFDYLMLGIFAFVAQSLLARNRGRLVLLAKVFLTSTLFLATWVIVTDFRQAFDPGSIRARAILGDWRDALSSVALGNTSHLGDMLALGLLLWGAAFFLARATWARALAIVALWFHAAAMIVVWSVHSNLSAVIGAGVLAALLWRPLVRHRLRRLAKPMVAVVIGWIFVVGFYVVDHRMNPHGSAVWAPTLVGVANAPEHGGIMTQAFASPRWKAGWESRVAIWLISLEVARKAPWLGVGAGNLPYVYPSTVSLIVARDPDLNKYVGTWTNAAHNEIIQFWAELGVVGLALLVLLFAFPIRDCLTRISSTYHGANCYVLAAVTAMLAAMIVQCQMNFPLQLPASFMVLAVLVVVPGCLPRGRGEELEMIVPVQRRYGAFVLGILLKNMSTPTEIRAHFELPKPVRFAFAGALTLACVALAVPLSAPLRADVEYRFVRESRLHGGIPIYMRNTVLAKAEDVLRIWPGHVDCRSAYTEILLEAKRWEDVVAQTPMVLRRLNAIEVYERRATALQQLGRAEEATPDLLERQRRLAMRVQ